MKDMREEAKKFTEFWTFRRGSSLLAFLCVCFVPMIAISDQEESTAAPLTITEVNLDSTGFGGKLSWLGAVGVPTDTTIDVFGAWPAITNDWRWVGEIPLYGVTTNCQWRFEADHLGLTEMPAGVFVKMTERSTTANTMVDSDGDLIPDVYELNHGTNPYVADFENVPKITVGATGAYTTLSSALGVSVPYSVVELPRGEDVDANGVVMPSHPVMIVGPTNGYASVKTTAAPYAFALQDGQDYETIYQNLYIEMLPSMSPQVAFWCGSNLPLGITGGAPAASATFRNVYLRARCADGLGIGWFVRKWQLSPIEIDHCTINADGSNHFIGISAVNAPSITIKNSTFVNFPPEVGNDYGAAVQEEVVGAANNNYAVTITNCVFDASFTNAYPLARLGSGSIVETHNVILPEGYRNDYEPDATSGVIVSTNAVVSWTGHAIPDGLADMHGIGSMAALGEADQTDSDGDGLRDWEEIYVYGTNPYRSDSDGDKVSDSIEVAEGSNPRDANDYCFSISLSQSITLCTNNVVTITLGENVVLDYTATYHVTNGVRPTLTMSNGTYSVNVAYQITGSTIELGSLDNDNDDMPDIWELSAGLNPMLGDDSTEDSDGDGLINLHEYWARANPFESDSSNTLLSVFSRGVDDLLGNGGARAMFVNYPSESMTTSMPTTIVRNQDFFAASVDLTSVSVWNSLDNTQRCATVVSPYHIVGAAHWQIPAGQQLCFVGDDGVVYTNKVKSAKSYQYHYWNSPANTLDVAVGILENPLPAAVHPVKILPMNATEYIGTGKRLPVLSLTQDRYAYVREISTTILPQNTDFSTSISYGRPTKSTRQEYYGTMRNGDSSCPNFLICGTTPVLLGCHLTANGAPSIILTQPHIQRMMNELSDQYGMPRYEIEYLDMSQFQPIGGAE